MPIQIEPNDFRFLEDVERLGAEGKSQEEIATALGLTRGTLNYRLLQLGYRMESTVRLRSTALGQTFSQLRADRTVVKRDEPALAGAAA